MLSMVIFGSLMTAVGIFSILAKSSPSFLRLSLGYEAMIDLGLTILICLYAGLSGTISGMLIGAMTGVCISGVLFVLKRTVGYAKMVKNPDYDENNPESKALIRQEIPAVWTISYAKSLFNKQWADKSAKFSRQGQYGFKKAA